MFCFMSFTNVIKNGEYQAGKPYKGMVFTNARPDVGKPILGVHIAEDGVANEYLTSDVLRAKRIKAGNWGLCEKWVVETHNSRYMAVVLVNPANTPTQTDDKQ